MWRNWKRMLPSKQLVVGSSPAMGSHHNLTVVVYLFCVHAMSGSPNDYSAEGGEYCEPLGYWHWMDSFGRRHRDNDQPALICDRGSMSWWKHGEPHRLSGLALISEDGKDDRWYVNGRRCYTEEEFIRARDDYIREHDIYVSGRLTKRATPN